MMRARAALKTMRVATRTLRYNSCTLAVACVATATLASAQAPFPEIWTNRAAGTVYRLTLKGQHFRAEKIFPAAFAAQVADGAFVRCDYAPSGEAWDGKCEARLPFPTGEGHGKWCKFKFTSSVNSFTPSRIEGESDVWQNEDVDVDKCEVRRSHRQHFVWVPKS